jgi:hypothetical protein
MCLAYTLPCITLYRGTYILPGGKATSRCIAPFEEEAISRLPYVRDAFGKDYSYTEKRIVAPIRLVFVLCVWVILVQLLETLLYIACSRMGGMGGREYGQQCLLVGDAAGHVDPLTGTFLRLIYALCCY